MLAKGLPNLLTCGLVAAIRAGKPQSAHQRKPENVPRVAARGGVQHQSSKDLLPHAVGQACCQAPICIVLILDIAVQRREDAARLHCSDPFTALHSTAPQSLLSARLLLHLMV